ncbi:MAG: 23S rRNA (pseudouridine(1915)-N(3))-methyltransferase RlmH [candidate division Zixibacteria bacterium]|nr:23S rRNA (pseudouridine(1915)-N(3))-methyltransferase RlmH [candidate division Zixibacteria bacterium]
MLSIHIIVVGKDKDKGIAELSAHFKKMIRKYARLEMTFVPESKYNSSTDISKARAVEADAILGRLKGGYIISLEVTGQSLNTHLFAERLNLIQLQGNSKIDFIIGGPFGLDAKISQKADMLLSFSSLTMSHQIIRLVLLEQLYRVLNMNAGGSYHK